MRIYFATALVDMRNGVDGLRTIVEQVLKRNPNEGHLFVFVGKRRDMIKILFWDKNGYVVYFKRLERGRFQLPAVDEKRMKVEMEAAQLAIRFAPRDAEDELWCWRFRDSFGGVRRKERTPIDCTASSAASPRLALGAPRTPGGIKITRSGTSHARPALFARLPARRPRPAPPRAPTSPLVPPILRSCWAPRAGSGPCRRECQFCDVK
ncbi:MAG: IS66 family insertion sequence element accessory protein TnpB [Kofleriaceae bacterium]